MRIDIVRTSEVAPGCGAGLLAGALAAAGHRVRLLTDAPDDPESVFPVRAPGELTVHALGDDPTGALANDPAEVVHAIGPVAGRAAAAAGVPFVQVCPAGGPHAVPPGAGPVVVASEDQQLALIRAGVPRARLRIVPACVDTDAVTPDGPTLRRGGRPRVVALGPPDGGGAGPAISALARIRSAELLIAGGAGGDDPARNALFTVARELGVAGRVRFLGPVDPVLLPRLLRSADAVVAPTRDVPAGPVLQAMACSRPVVASPVGGLGEAVVDRVTGLHVRPGRVDDVAAALRELLGDVSLRVAYGIAGRDRAVSRFDRTRIAAALLAIYEEVVAGTDGVPEPVGTAG